ncbi:MAG: hypothetical protein HPY53_14325 [Brevinematales bacterium]|nr:hypothetical protein [Brevinematales bacterium]
MFNKSSFILIGIMTLFLSGLSWGKEITVKPGNPKDLYAAVNNAQDGDTIILRAGKYFLKDTLEINGMDNLTIIGIGKVDILLADVYQDVISIVDCGKIFITNIHAQHVQPLTEYECHGSVIRIENTQETHIYGCELNGCGAVGVNAYNAETIYVENCYVHNNSFNAFYLSKVTSVNILHNTIKDNKSFAQFYECKDIMIYGNETANNTGYWDGMGE